MRKIIQLSDKKYDLEECSWNVFLFGDNTWLWKVINLAAEELCLDALVIQRQNVKYLFQALSFTQAIWDLHKPSDNRFAPLVC